MDPKQIGTSLDADGFVRRDPPYRAYRILANGSREPIEAAYSVVVELKPGVEVEIMLAPHPGFDGHLVLMTPPIARMAELHDAGRRDDFAILFGASNVLHVAVDRRQASSSTPEDGEVAC